MTATNMCSNFDGFSVVLRMHIAMQLQVGGQARRIILLKTVNSALSYLGRSLTEDMQCSSLVAVL